MKSAEAATTKGETSHLPHGRCGLKSVDLTYLVVWFESPPAREVWIEMTAPHIYTEEFSVTSRTGGVD